MSGRWSGWSSVPCRITVSAPAASSSATQSRTCVRRVARLDRRVRRDVGATDRLPRAAYDVGVGHRVEQHAVADLAGEGDGLRAAGTDEQPGRLGRRPVERHLVERDVPALHVDGLPGQQRADRGGVLAQQRHGGVDRGADLAHPVLDAVAERDGEPAREQPGQRGQLHGGQRRVAERHRQQPDPDRDPLGPGQRRGGGGQPALEEAVLPQPQLVDAGRLRGTRRRPGAARAGTGVGTPHRSSCRRLCQTPPVTVRSTRATPRAAGPGHLGVVRPGGSVPEPFRRVCKRLHLTQRTWSPLGRERDGSEQTLARARRVATRNLQARHRSVRWRAGLCGPLPPPPDGRSLPSAPRLSA